MKRLIALALAISTGAAAAIASDSQTTPVDDATTQAITQTLMGQGYQVTEIEAEDGGFEAYAMKDGTFFEIELNADLAITEIEENDDDND